MGVPLQFNSSNCLIVGFPVTWRYEGVFCGCEICSSCSQNSGVTDQYLQTFS
ncbi:hypothetical protein IFM89_010552 [Coptis chinensis]|uniref:Uncharacterized protein n=1 Tax=Coptis chinensis TaxID=261450 RepID=A0A835IL34_9MAGN|nr:hypothetical protein IFM89_010552 [Coptis chinensis]